MKLLRIRNLIFLAFVYLLLISLLYHYLWQARALGKLFEMPGDPQGTHTSHTDTVYYEDPADLSQGVDPGRVEFNFKRNPAPQGIKVYNGHRKTSNSSKPAQTNTRTDNVASNVTNTHHKDAPSVDKSLSTPQILSPSSRPLKNHSLPRPNQCLHAFYYAWYGNLETDGRYMHWNHHYMPHWKNSITQQHPQGRHNPPDDIGASFYPELGCYSSNDVAVISAHMQQLQEAGVGVIAVSWYPAGLSDDEGPPPDPVIPVLLDAALDYGVKVTLHIEPYKGRTPQSVRDDLQYIHAHYSQHPAFYKLQRSGEASSKRQLPLIYIYDSYLSEAGEWAKVLKPGGALSVRGRDHDCLAIALLVDHKHMQFAVDGGFDGVYTYFAAEGFSFGSTFRNWASIFKFTHQHSLLFIPSFGPGYDDLQVRPWNRMTSQDRKGGAYYREGFAEALKHSSGGIVSVTSFNEWGEGTQIEPAVPRQREGYTYLDYSPEGPGLYLQLTRQMSEQLALDCGIT